MSHLGCLAECSVSGLQVNYAHNDEGGPNWGHTYESDPPLFSAERWDFYSWFVEAADERGMALSLGDYTLATPGQGWFNDEIIDEYLDIQAESLHHATRDVEGSNAGSGTVRWDLPENTVSVVAYERSGESHERSRDDNEDSVDAIVPDSGVDLRPHVRDGVLSWRS